MWCVCALADGCAAGPVVAREAGRKAGGAAPGDTRVFADFDMRDSLVQEHTGWVSIDGSLGEGGGQVLRTALSLSVLTGRPVRLTNIRARRAKPGLMPQHLKAVEAAAAVSRARTDGARLGSQTLEFEPGGIAGGDFAFDIGTAGSTSLVLQTVAVPLAFADKASSILLTGGTHVPRSPCFDYLALHWALFMRRIGFGIELQLEQAGFYPRGGGRVRAKIAGAAQPKPLRLVERGALKQIRVVSAVAKLPRAIAERQRRQAFERLAAHCRDAEIETEIAELIALSPGTFLLLLAKCELSQCCSCALGERGKPAERVADETVDELLAFLATDGAIDPYLADQLLLPLAVTPGPSELRTARVTSHLLTNAAIVKTFLPAAIEIAGEPGKPGTVRIAGMSVARGRAGK
jgi:RNA 3'-terminal phosphate cyclase (ATP)